MKQLDAVVTAIHNGTAQQLAESAQTRQESVRNSQLLPRPQVIDLWELMGRMYGHKWTSNFGDQIDPGNVWARSLTGITPEQLRAGIGQLVKLGMDWPPSAPQFRNLCEGRNVEGDGTDTSWQHSRNSKTVDEALERDPTLALENITQREERKAKGRERMAAIRAELRI